MLHDVFEHVTELAFDNRVLLLLNLEDRVTVLHLRRSQCLHCLAAKVQLLDKVLKRNSNPWEGHNVVNAHGNESFELVHEILLVLLIDWREFLTSEH